MASQDSEIENSQKSLKTQYEDGIYTGDIAFSTFSQEALAFTSQRARSSKYRTRRDEVIARLLCRWWYILPEWPTPFHDYSKELLDSKLKLLNLVEYEKQPDVDSEGFTKVYEIDTYKGVFRGPGGKIYDLRNKDKCPSYDYIASLDDRQIILMLQAAIINQIKCMVLSNIDEAEITPFINELKTVSGLTNLDDEY